MPTRTANRFAHLSEAANQDKSEANLALKLQSVRPFLSILFDERGAWTEGDEEKAPEFLGDLNLDQIVTSITNGCDEYSLKRFF